VNFSTVSVPQISSCRKIAITLIDRFLANTRRKLVKNASLHPLSNPERFPRCCETIPATRYLAGGGAAIVMP